MANHISALKRQRQNEKRRLRNLHTKSTIRTYVRRVREAITAKDAESAQKQLITAVSAIDKAVSGGVYHKRAGQRKISRLSKAVHGLGA